MYAIYARQSVDKADSISIESQIAFCRYEVRGEEYREYTDRGYSGKNTDRPQFQQLLADIQKGQITKVIVYKLDRISRSILDFSNMMETFRKYGVEFVSSTEKFDTSSPMGRAMLNICIVFAQLERETIQKRVADAYYSRSQKSLYMGGRVPYGFRLESASIQGIKTSRYVVCPEEALIVHKIYELYAEPQTSYGDILRAFQEQGITYRGKPWDRTFLGYLLRNPVYVRADLDVYEFFKGQGAEIVNDAADFIGENACYLYQPQGGKARRRDKLSGYLLVLAPHTGLISSEQWLKCRKKCLKNKQIQPGRKAKNTWLAGIAKCDVCGHSLMKKFYSGGRLSYYHCSQHIHSNTCPGGGTIRAEELEEITYREMCKKLREFLTLNSRKAMPESNPRKSAIQLELVRLEQDIGLLLDSLLDANDVLRRYANTKILELDSRKKALSAELAELSVESMGGAQALQISGYLERWDTLPFPDRQQVAGSLIQTLRAASGRVSIQWKI